MSSDKRYTVFVSSTYKDLISIRDEVIKTLMRVKHIPLGMEAFNASNSSSWDIIKKTIDISDYYIIIIGVRYGSLHKTEKISYTEMEYNYATESNVPCYIFIASDKAVFPVGNKDNEAKLVKKLSEFKKRLMTDGRNIVEWDNVGDLTTKVTAALTEAIADVVRPGWIRSFQDSPETVNELARLSKRNFDLEEELKDFRSSSNLYPILKCTILNFEEEVLYLQAESTERIRTNCRKSFEGRVREAIENPKWGIQNQYRETVTPIAKAMLSMASVNQNYTVDDDRIAKVKDLLRIYNIDPKTFNWSFNLIGAMQPYTGYNGMPLMAMQAIGGLDFEKYKIFQSLERIDSQLDEKIKAEVIKNSRFEILLEVENISRIAAKDVKIEITFSDSKTDIDSFMTEKNTKTVLVANISPSDSFSITDTEYIIDNYTHYHIGNYEESLRVKITGSNLPQSQQFDFPVIIEVI